MSIKASRFYGIGLALLTVGSFVACSSDDTPPPTGTAGTGNTAGTSAAAGTSTGGTSSTAGTGNTAGTGTAGTATGGSGGSGGSGGGSGTACAGVKPASALITEFADLVANPMSAGQFTFTLGVPGGTFAYQPADIMVANTGMALNVKGIVKNYDGFGVYTNACMDASAYTGVSFSIKGKVGAGGKLNFRVQTNSNTAVDPVNKKGTCVVPMGVTDPWEACHASAVDIPVTMDAKTIEVKFADLTGGVPVAAVTGKDIVGLEWAFAWPPAAPTGGTGGGASGGSGGTSGGSGGASGGSGGASGGSGGAVPGQYEVEVTLDNLKFIGGPPSGGSGSGGSAGMGGTGGGSGGTGGTGGASGGTGGTN